MTYDPTSGATRDTLRFLIGDRGALSFNPEIYSDDELDMILTEAEDGLYDAAVLCYLGMAADAARQAVAWKVLGQDLEIDKRQIAQHFRLLAESMAERAEVSGTAGSWITWTDENIRELLEGRLQVGMYDDEFQENGDEV